MAKANDLTKFQDKKPAPEPSIQNNNGKIKKAQSLYEPWMDFMEGSPSVKEYTDSPTREAKLKERSQFKFDKNYLNEFSTTPSPVPSHSNSQNANSKYKNQNGKDGTEGKNSQNHDKNSKLEEHKKPSTSDSRTRKISTPIKSSLTRRPSSEITIRLNHDSNNQKRTPTPLPTFNEFDKMKAEQNPQNSKNLQRISKNLNFAELPHNDKNHDKNGHVMNSNNRRNSSDVNSKSKNNIDQLKRQSLVYNDLNRSVSVLAVPKTTSIATSPFEFEIDIDDYTEFYRWLMNGNENDSDQKLIEKLLFHARRRIRQRL